MKFMCESDLEDTLDAEVNIFVLPDGTYCRSNGKEFVPVSSEIQKKLEHEYEKQQRLQQAEAEGQNIRNAEEQDRIRHQRANYKDSKKTPEQDKQKDLKGNYYQSNLTGDQKRKLMSKSYFHGKDHQALSQVLLEILHDTIANEIIEDIEDEPQPQIVQRKSYTRPDEYHNFGNILVKGRIRSHIDPDYDEEDEENEEEILKPLVLFYQDVSGSFDRSDKKDLARKIYNLINSEEFADDIDVTNKWFDEEVHDEYPGYGGGTELSQVLHSIEELSKDKLVNVVILTDDDTSADSVNLNIPINGSVFLIFVGCSPSKLSRNFNLQGDSVLKEFSFEDI